MSPPARTCPPKPPNSKRPDAEHEAIWRLYILEGRSATKAAAQMTVLFPGSGYTAGVIVGYSARNGWKHAANPSTAKSPSNGDQPTDVVNGKPRRLKERPAGPRAVTLAHSDRVDEDGRVVARTCRFPVGKTPPAWAMADQLFCGEVQDAATAPYCLRCAGRAYPSLALERKIAAHAAKA